MTGPLADPGLSPLILWLVLPAVLLTGAACLALWRGRRGWVVVEAVIRTLPDPSGPGATTGIAWRDETGEVREAQLHLPALPGRRRAGDVIVLCHPPGQPGALQPGTPGPLLAGAVGSGLVAALCIAILLGV